MATNTANISSQGLTRQYKIFSNLVMQMPLYWLDFWVATGQVGLAGQSTMSVALALMAFKGLVCSRVASQRRFPSGFASALHLHR
jgi:hypothetical protein